MSEPVDLEEVLAIADGCQFPANAVIRDMADELKSARTLIAELEADLADAFGTRNEFADELESARARIKELEIDLAMEEERSE